MSRDDIIRMAREAGGMQFESDSMDFLIEGVIKFARLVAAAEREACADEADYWIGFDKTASQACVEIAAAIRARGQA